MLTRVTAAILYALYGRALNQRLVTCVSKALSIQGTELMYRVSIMRRLIVSRLDESNLIFVSIYAFAKINPPYLRGMI